MQDTLVILHLVGFYMGSTGNNLLFIEDDGEGAIKAFYRSQGSKIYLKTNIGTVNYNEGSIELNGKNFNPTAIDPNTQEMSVYIKPENDDLSPIRNQIILISNAKIELYDDKTKELLEVGTITTEGDSAHLDEVPLKITV